MPLQTDNDKIWYALYTRPRHEKSVDDQLQEKGIESYLPLKKVLKQWSDRRKWVEEPLFRSYVFVHGNKQINYQAVQTHGAVCLLSFSGKPARIYDWEIETIQRILKEKPETEPCSIFQIGDWVEISNGSLQGLRGRLQEIHGEKRLIITVESIQQAMRFSVNINDVRRVA